MIAFLRGKVLTKRDSDLIIDVNGVGYEVFAPTSVCDSLLLADNIELHICTVVREDAFTLFGFSSTSQKQTFNTLRSVNKIGAKLALGILSHFDVNTLARAIESNDSRSLSSIPGIGKKTAERMCLELKGKLNADLNLEIEGIKPIKRQEDPLQLALAQLDYRKTEIDGALQSPTVPKMDSAPLEDRLRAALRFLAKQS
jgi:holliday junction DNA helicase RuvA